jgi:ligand-binding sensor domain-containing protein/two-component sensor histidine kinase
MACGRFWLTLSLLLQFAGVYSQSPFFNYQRDHLSRFESYRTSDGLSARKILDIQQDRRGFLWIATENGLNRFDGYQFLHYLADSNDSTSISNNHITSLAVDTAGNLWVGTHDGLNFYNRENGTFKVFRHNPDNSNSLSHDHVRDLHADDQGHLWIETLDGILNRYDISSGHFAYFRHNKVEQPYYEYHAIYEDQRGDLWIGGRTMGPYRFIREQERFVFYPSDPNQPGKKRDTDAAAFLEDSYGKFWVSGIDGIYQFDREGERFTQFYGTSTYDMLEDREGYIWFATGNGVLRYESTSRELLHYKSDQNNKHSLTQDDVTCLFEDRTGNIWFGTTNGLNKYSPEKSRFQHIYHVPGNENTLSADHVTSMMVDDHQNLWIGTKANGLDRLDLNTRKMVHYRKDSTNPGSLAANEVSDIYQDRNGDVWVGLWKGVGFQKYDENEDAFRLYSHNPDNRKTDWYMDFLEDSRGRFWVGFWGADGILEFNRYQEHFETPRFNPLNKRPIDKKVTSLALDGEGSIWILAGGLYRYNMESGQMAVVPITQELQSCIRSSIQNVFSLSDGSFWIAAGNRLIRYSGFEQDIVCHELPQSDDVILDVTTSRNDSLIFVRTNRRFYLFSSISKKYNAIDVHGLPENVAAYSLFKESLYYADTSGVYRWGMEDNHVDTVVLLDASYRISQILPRDTLLYIGTHQGLLRYNRHNKKLRMYKKQSGQPGSLSGNLITTLYQDRQGWIWVGTTHGLNRFDPSGERFDSWRSDAYDPASLVHDNILSLTEDTRGDIWVGTSKGLCVWDRRSGRFSSFNQSDSFSLTSRLTTCMLEDDAGYLWVGTTNKGLNRIHLQTGQVEHYRHLSSDTSSLSSDEVTCLFEDSNHNLWVGTSRGLNRLQKSHRGFMRYDWHGELRDQYISAIQEDDQDYLWVSTHHGLFRLHNEDQRVVAFYQSDGLQGNHFTRAHCKLPDGRLAFGGEKGITLFHPEEITAGIRRAQIHITAFDQFEHTIRTDFHPNSRIVLDHDKNFFTIHFSTLDFIAPEKVRYTYRLSGVNKDWVHSEDNHAAYTDIGPGEYVFEVKGSYDNRFWSDSPARLILRIRPPFWRTGWFIVLGSSLLLAVLAFVIRMRFQSLRKEKYSLELEQRLLRSQMNPHFVFNSLTSIQNYMLDNHSAKASRYLAKFSKLLRLILDNSRNESITLDQEIQTLDHYLTLQKSRYDRKFDYTLQVDPSLDPEFTRIPPMLVQPYVENAIEHGFKPLSQPGRLSVLFEADGSYIKITVEDNGIGIRQSEKLHQVKSREHQSLANTITRERIQNMNRFGKHKIGLVVKDLKELDADGRGTRVTIWLPLPEGSESVSRIKYLFKNIRI